MGNIKDAIEDMNNLVKDIDKDEYNEIQELQSRVDWLEKGMKEIQDSIANKGINFFNREDIKEVLNLTVSYLDGEPTTADEFNE